MDEKATREPPPYEGNNDVIVHQPSQGYAYPPPAAPVGSQVPQAFAATGPGVYQNVGPPGGPQQHGGQVVMMAGGQGGAGVFFGGPPGSVVTSQPGVGAPIVMIPSHIVVGLDYLANLDKMFVKQKIEVLEILTGFETENKYEVRDSNNIPIFKAKEHSDCCSRNCLGPLRSFEMTIENFMGQEVMHFSRPFACQSCCCPCCLQTLNVYAPPGNLVGTVHQEWSICIPKYVVKDVNGKDVLKIRGPCVTCSCCGGDVDFKVLALDGETEVGRISKKWSGLAREAFTDADNFGISFPKDLTVEMKATLLGACKPKKTFKQVARNIRTSKFRRHGGTSPESSRARTYKVETSSRSAPGVPPPLVVLGGGGGSPKSGQTGHGRATKNLAELEGPMALLGGGVNNYAHKKSQAKEASGSRTNPQAKR